MHDGGEELASQRLLARWQRLGQQLACVMQGVEALLGRALDLLEELEPAATAHAPVATLGGQVQVLLTTAIDLANHARDLRDLLSSELAAYSTGREDLDAPTSETSGLRAACAAGLSLLANTESSFLLLETQSLHAIESLRPLTQLAARDEDEQHTELGKLLARLRQRAS